MIFIDGSYKDTIGQPQVETIELSDFNWEDINFYIRELFKWETITLHHILYIEVWDGDDDEPLCHYSREEALKISNPIMKYCKSIWRLN